MTLSSGNKNMPPLADSSFSLQRRRKVVLVVDLVESVSLMQADELGVIQRWQAFLAHVNQIVLPHNEGRLVKSLGDGLMLEFDAAPRAAAAASAMHDWMARQAAPLQRGDRLQLRAGMHAADVYVDQHDIYGTGVNIAARMATLAGPGETVATTEARDELTDGLDGTIEDLGSCYLKHLGEPVRAYKVGQKGATAPPPGGFGHAGTLQPTIAVVPFESRVSDPEHFRHRRADCGRRHRTVGAHGRPCRRVAPEYHGVPRTIIDNGRGRPVPLGGLRAVRELRDQRRKDPRYGRTGGSFEPLHHLDRTASWRDRRSALAAK
ncbi:adenylate/guanylate cyclase domain-containing protein [Variovorax paradoxus]|nr:adenylate/guanylate cyclase domain-containing protein [Variovorax paradoxus]